MNRLRWARHAGGYPIICQQKITLGSQPFCDGRIKGHPETRWIDGVLKDLKVLGIRKEY
jgi:hypothetical protein